MDSCICSANPTLFFACSGGSNAGQIANDACRQLAAEGHGKLFCLAGIGGHVRGLVESAKSGKVVVIDGCGMKCAQKTLEAANVPISHYIILSDWRVGKKLELIPEQQEVQRTKDRIIAIIE